jgi:hypothetical protein
LVIEWVSEGGSDGLKQCVFADGFAQKLAGTGSQSPAFLFVASAGAEEDNWYRRLGFTQTAL